MKDVDIAVPGAHGTGPEKKKNSSVRAVAAASIGNALEWYDFSLYAFFAVYISHNFFADGNDTVQLIKTFIAFGLGFVVRPLGAVVLGVYGDRAGRKAALTMTIMTMAVGTLIIAAAPSYAAIGIGAPLLIVCGRMLQGFSAGGEIGGATAFLVEHAPPAKKGIYASWLQASMGISNIMAALMATIMTALLTKEQMFDWGWRVPFIVGLTIAPIGLWLRKTLDETPQFQAEMERRRHQQVESKMPLFQVVQEYPRQLFVGFGFSILWVVCVYTLIIYMPTYVQKVLKFSSEEAFQASLIGNIFMVAGCVATGMLADRIGRYRVLSLGAIGLLVGVYPLLAWLGSSHTLGTLIMVQILLCSLVSLFAGVAPLALSEIFGVHVRSTGMSLSYNLAAMTFGGFAPAILTWLVDTTASTYAPAWYVMAASVMALLSLAFMPRKITSTSHLSAQES